jgi:hypothetical protein
MVNGWKVTLIVLLSLGTFTAIVSVGVAAFIDLIWGSV